MPSKGTVLLRMGHYIGFVLLVCERAHVRVVPARNTRPLGRRFGCEPVMKIVVAALKQCTMS